MLCIVTVLCVRVSPNYFLIDIFFFFYVFQILMASEHFIPSKFVFSADYAPVVKNFPILAALAEACLWPVVMLLFDDQFVPRLSNLYRRRSISDKAKPPQGKCCTISLFSLIRHSSARVRNIWFWALYEIIKLNPRLEQKKKKTVFIELKDARRFDNYRRRFRCER